MQRRPLVAAPIAFAFLLGCQDAAQHPQSTERREEIETRSAADGLERDLPRDLQSEIDALDADIAAGEYGMIDEVLVVRDGETVFHLTYDRDYGDLVDLEAVKDGPFKYDDGAFAYADPDWHPYYRETKLHTLQSVTKTIVSLLIGVAEMRSELPDIRTAKLLDHIDDRYQTPHRNEWLEAVTIEHLVSMTMNLEWDDSLDRSGGETGLSNLEQLEWQEDDWVQYVLNQPMAGPPGSVYEYNSGATQLLSAVIEHATGKNLAEYADEHLFKPLGVTDYYWKTSPAGLYDALGGLYLHIRELPKFCELMGARGDWRGRRLITEDYAIRSLTPISYFNESGEQIDESGVRGFGYTWWTGAGSGYSAERPFEINSGYGGQFVYCSPASNSVTALLAWNVSDLQRPDLTKDEYQVSPLLKKRIDDVIMPLWAQDK
ncbi:MAG: serine hydrolase [Pseudomonadota bacterium]